MTQLFGMSPSGLATDDESGRANWRKQIKTYQEQVLCPALEKYYRLVTGKEIKVVFNALDEATALEEAEIRKLDAETRNIYVAAGIAGGDEFREDMVREGVIQKAEREDGLEGDADLQLPEAFDEDLPVQAGEDVEDAGPGFEEDPDE